MLAPFCVLCGLTDIPPWYFEGNVGHMPSLSGEDENLPPNCSFRREMIGEMNVKPDDGESGKEHLGFKERIDAGKRAELQDKGKNQSSQIQ